MDCFSVEDSDGCEHYTRKSFGGFVWCVEGKVLPVPQYDWKLRCYDSYDECGGE